MLFTTFSFLLFFAVVLGVSRTVRSWTLNKLFLLLMSYLFYAVWFPAFTSLLWISTLGNWYLARWMHKTESVLHRKACLTGSLVLNLGLLAFFKYGGFLLDNIHGLSQWLSIRWEAPAWNIILPIGISFYTFQTLSYTIDVYRRKIAPWRRFLDYALYVTFFPQLIAGPIVRAVDFLPQCEQPRRATDKQLGWGLILLLIGLFQKMVISDHLLTPVADSVFGHFPHPHFVAAWAGVLAFAMQIYYDFSGYSNCAIGVALCLGFALPMNFHFPYAAVGFSDFWRRWHISLSSWLRDYLYVPLGGNRHGRILTLRNLILTMFLGGLWHGASWMFVIWGLLHGFYLIVERILQTLISKTDLRLSGSVRFVLMLVTFLLICAAWVFFRAQSMQQAGILFQGMFGMNGAGRLIYPTVFAIAAATLFIHWKLRDKSLEEGAALLPSWLRITVLGVMLFSVFVALCGVSNNAFIYFQF